MTDHRSTVVRRNFIKDSGLMIAGGAIGGAVAIGKTVQGSDSRPLRIAIVGCGKRSRELVDAAMSVEATSLLVSGLADHRGSQVQSFYRSLKGRFTDRVALDCIRAHGRDCLSEIVESDADAIYVATPPVSRPDILRRCIESGKHVFLEKPLGADVEGVLSSLAAAKLATSNGLTAHVGFQRRYDARYRDVIAQIHEGLIGSVIFAKAYCNAGPLRAPAAKPNESDAEFQLRNWPHYQWTGGDFLLEQHVAGLDAVRWALNESPVRAQGQGGWSDWAHAEEQANSSLEPRQVYDHHHVEYGFASGVTLVSQCRRVAKAWNQTSEHIYGTQGHADLTSGKIFSADGKLIWRSKASFSLKTATINQQRCFLDSIQTGKAENQIESGAESTLFALMGLSASRSGKRIQWDRMLQEAIG